MDLIKLHDFMEIALPLRFFLGNLQSFRRSNFCRNTSNWLLKEKKMWKSWFLVKLLKIFCNFLKKQIISCKRVFLCWFKKNIKKSISATSYYLRQCKKQCKKQLCQCKKQLFQAQTSYSQTHICLCS